ncbi:MAG: hypothetical protein RLZZ292_1354 [Bacteroidota bacterium]
MKTKTIFFVLLFALPFLGKAQSSSLGLSSSYMVGKYYKQYGLGLTFANQFSDYVSGRLTMQGVFSQGGTRIRGHRIFCPPGSFTTTANGYDKRPSILETSYLVRFRPTNAKHKMRLVVGTGLLYRWTDFYSLFYPKATIRTDVFIPEENNAIGVPLNLGLEIDLNKHISLALEGETRSFLELGNELNLSRTFFYYGANMNLVYHFYSKKKGCSQI